MHRRPLRRGRARASRDRSTDTRRAITSTASTFEAWVFAQRARLVQVCCRCGQPAGCARARWRLPPPSTSGSAPWPAAAGRTAARRRSPPWRARRRAPLATGGRGLSRCGAQPCAHRSGGLGGGAPRPSAAPAAARDAGGSKGGAASPRQHQCTHIGSAGSRTLVGMPAPTPRPPTATRVRRPASAAYRETACKGTARPSPATAAPAPPGLGRLPAACITRVSERSQIAFPAAAGTPEAGNGWPDPRSIRDGHPWPVRRSGPRSAAPARATAPRSSPPRSSR